VGHALETPAEAPFVREGRRYLRRPVPVVFPVEEEMPETGRHLELRTLLYQLLKHHFADHASIGSEQFVYWNPTSPRDCCAPDAFVRLGAPHTVFDIWKVWERGAPQLAVEIVSPSDKDDAPWDRKLERFRRAGFREVVRFDPENEQAPLALWDEIGSDLVERDLSGPNARFCATLGLHWVVLPDALYGQVLRLARDAEGVELLPTRDELNVRAEEERARAEEERARAEEERARAEEERARAEEERARAEEERARAEVRADKAEEEVARLRRLLAERDPT
jgi:hypothetical protein